MYGIIRMNCGGSAEMIGALLSRSGIATANPNSQAKNISRTGFQFDRISAASAMNPRPGAVPSRQLPTTSAARNAPDAPANAPESSTPWYRYTGTLTPSDRVASGFSPHDRRRRPHRVRFSEYHTGNTMSAATITIGDSPSNARSRPPGSDDSPGMSSRARCGPPGSDCVDWPSKNVEDRKRASPTATRLITTPDTMWSTRNVIV